MHRSIGQAPPVKRFASEEILKIEKQVSEFVSFLPLPTITPRINRHQSIDLGVQKPNMVGRLLLGGIKNSKLLKGFGLLPS